MRVDPKNLAALIIDVRTEFAQRAERRFEGMIPNTAKCECDPKRATDHEPPCPGYYWERSANMIRMLLEEFEEDEAEGS